MLTALALLLVLGALVAPTAPAALTPAAFARIPVEGLVGAAVLLVLPDRARRPAAVLAGASLGLLAVLKVLDAGFSSVLARPFDPLVDWALLGAGLEFLTSSVGRAGAIAAVVAAVVLAAALVVLTALAVRRLARLAGRHRAPTARAVAALTPVWVACAVLGTQIVPGVPVASGSTAALVRDHAVQARDGVAQRRAFAAAVATDPLHDVPADELLTGLRGKDVVVAFVESYGRDAVEDPAFAPQVGAVLAEGDRTLAAAGFASRSGFLTSSTTGGGSWLAHATFLSGLWVDDEHRHDALVGSERRTLTGAFRRAGWRTAAVMPGTTGEWPEASFYGYDEVYDWPRLGYRGPDLGWATVPDQYTLAAFERAEHGRADRPPLMAEIALVSSHAPWPLIPRLLDWDAVGDGSVFHAMTTGEPRDAVWAKGPDEVRATYRRSIEYSLRSLVSWVETYGDDDLVLVLLGDHQPLPSVTGGGASRDVPISIVARDPAVLDRITGWGWHAGLQPGPQAPVWPMDAFRDRFLTAFGRHGGQAPQ
ncbi:sulfatase-like hydrolase/transferase [Pseudonocardia sichuanensis]